jgi:heme/copper-type cytochrome/quinol oxidase subunit 2
MSWRDRLRLFLILFGPAAVLVAVWSVRASSAFQTRGPTERPFTVVAKRYSFDPPRIEVLEGDLVKIDLRTLDIAHSFTIDEYRISKRVGSDHPVTFEFLAEHAGVFRFYCNLQIDEGCRGMRGELVVKPRP